MPALTWIIGRGGLLGHSLVKAMGAGGHIWNPPIPIAWSTPDAGSFELRRQARLFLTAAGDGPWSVAWCAGAGITGTSSQALQMEIVALKETLEALSAAPRGRDGTFFLASSAGGVYAGVATPPYNESSPVRPLAAYGQAKLDAEALVTAWSRHTGTSALIGRITNIYGPGQNLRKGQGLISQICLNGLTGKPLSIYVSLDTLRDYLFAPDCAGLIIDGLARLRQECQTHPMVITKILASQRAITISAVLGEMRRIFKRPPQIAMGASSVSSMQARNLSVRSLVWPELDHRSLTPFPVGIALTGADLLRRLQAGEL